MIINSFYPNSNGNSSNKYIWDGENKLGDLAIGSKVKINEDSDPKTFIVLDKNHYGANTGVTLIREKTFARTAYNAGYSNFNVYFGATLDNFCDGIWPLKLDPEVRECIVPVPIVVAEGNGVSTLHTIYRKAFALSCTEAGVNGWKTEGTAFAYFSDNNKRIAYLDGTTTAVKWGMRTPMKRISESTERAFTILEDGTLSPNAYNVIASAFAPRPVFNLNADMVVTSTVDSDGCYNFLEKQ